VERFGQPEAKLDDLAALFLTGFLHADSLALDIGACQYRHGIDRFGALCYTIRASTRARAVPS
jgi:hypothetical protein